jgi:hypothetical protein
MTHTHTRWGRWPIKGAYAPSGGHVRCFGFTYGWISQWDKEAKYSPSWSFDLLGLFYITGDPAFGTRWALGRLNLSFRPARHRIGEREKARDRRRAYREHKRLRATFLHSQRGEP